MMLGMASSPRPSSPNYSLYHAGVLGTAILVASVIWVTRFTTSKEPSRVVAPQAPRGAPRGARAQGADPAPVKESSDAGLLKEITGLIGDAETMYRGTKLEDPDREGKLAEAQRILEKAREKLETLPEDGEGVKAQRVRTQQLFQDLERARGL